MDLWQVAAGGRGGSGNIVNKDWVAPPPAPSRHRRHSTMSHRKHSSLSSANMSGRFFSREKGAMVSWLYFAEIILDHRVTDDGSGFSTTGRCRWTRGQRKYRKQGPGRPSACTDGPQPRNRNCTKPGGWFSEWRSPPMPAY